MFAGYLLLIESLTLADLMQGESRATELAGFGSLPLTD
jgi:hypothetical protein